MFRKNTSIIFYIIIGLAIIGFVANLLTNPGGLVKSILLIACVGVAVFALFSLIRSRSNINNADMKKYKKAVKQSQLRYTATHNPKHPHPIKVKNKRASHLRVIEGNKTKKKNRATF